MSREGRSGAMMECRVYQGTEQEQTEHYEARDNQRVQRASKGGKKQVTVHHRNKPKSDHGKSLPVTRKPEGVSPLR
jgi:hypothetical protein